MGMTIDEAEAIEILKDVWLNANYIQNRESLTGMACKLAIDIMRKYQKIEEIAKAYKNGATALGCINEICEVLEDVSN